MNITKKLKNKLKLNKYLNSIIPQKENNTEIARCSAQFLSKHVRSLNRNITENSYLDEPNINSKLNRRKPSLLTNKKVEVIAESERRNGKSLNSSITASVNIFKNAISKHKNKLMQIMDYNPEYKIEDFVKRMDRNEYYKEKIYDQDIYTTAQVENARYQLGKK